MAIELLTLDHLYEIPMLFVNHCMGAEVMVCTQYSLSCNLALSGMSSEETYQHHGISMLVDSGKITIGSREYIQLYSGTNSTVIAMELLSNRALDQCVMIQKWCLKLLCAMYVEESYHMNIIEVEKGSSLQKLLIMCRQYLGN